MFCVDLCSLPHVILLRHPLVIVCTPALHRRPYWCWPSVCPSVPSSFRFPPVSPSLRLSVSTSLSVPPILPAVSLRSILPFLRLSVSRFLTLFLRSFLPSSSRFSVSPSLLPFLCSSDPSRRLRPASPSLCLSVSTSLSLFLRSFPQSPSVLLRFSAFSSFPPLVPPSLAASHFTVPSHAVCAKIRADRRR